ncbi:unnamed protein product [Bursaphelenchus xylophilus]|uniref:(pine wood nematode) hypothetical protein n=1 Tax=Bursaphelenchus xylophilus TaxID=6326 RepID=A0A1I7RUZ2_BURXY|nr:unnamed protein product [Bursaphelenchus xylophilus]CAG9105282.1 unnamed protein product [Bursaphelenchus xylophilus]
MSEYSYVESALSTDSEQDDDVVFLGEWRHMVCRNNNHNSRNQRSHNFRNQRCHNYCNQYNPKATVIYGSISCLKVFY